mmetsp:Transcript_30253/g.95487  ORF Transcript_30253/g.95487 Transcript_30253/m.95487 type:complete len:299 (+) Transcript_30253:304-1200(+)
MGAHLQRVRESVAVLLGQEAVGQQRRDRVNAAVPLGLGLILHDLRRVDRVVGVEVQRHHSRAEGAIGQQGPPNPVVVVVGVYGEKVEIRGDCVLLEELHHVLCRNKLLLHDLGDAGTARAAAVGGLPGLRVEQDTLPSAELPEDGAVQHPGLSGTELHVEGRPSAALGGTRCVPETDVSEDGPQHAVLAALRADALLVVMPELQQPWLARHRRPLAEGHAPGGGIQLGRPGADVVLPARREVLALQGGRVGARNLLPLRGVEAALRGAAGAGPVGVDTRQLAQHLPKRPVRRQEVEKG